MEWTVLQVGVAVVLSIGTLLGLAYGIRESIGMGPDDVFKSVIGYSAAGWLFGLVACFAFWISLVLIHAFPMVTP